MADFRCPKHDVVFQATTDQRAPGAGKSSDGKLAAHPVGCHPDCPVGQADKTAKAPAASKPSGASW